MKTTLTKIPTQFTNFVTADKELRKEFESALICTRHSMEIEILTSKIQQKKNKLKNATETQTKALKEEICNLEKQVETCNLNVQTHFPYYEKVTCSAGENYKQAYTTFLRILACSFDSSFWNTAILPQWDGVERIYEVMEAYHNPSEASLNEVGIVKSGKGLTTDLKTLNSVLENALTKQFLVPNNAYTRKVVVRFNKTHLHALHENWTTGLKSGLSVKEEEDTLVYKNEGVSLVSAIQKKTKDNTTTYICKRFNGVMAKLCHDILWERAKKCTEPYEYDTEKAEAQA